IAGPRLQSGGIAPLGLMLQDVNSDKVPDLVITNSRDAPGDANGSLVALPGRGQGFFDDGSPITVELPGTPVAPALLAGPVGVIPDTNGDLIGFDPGALSVLGIVFSSAQASINALAVLDNEGNLVVAEGDGSVDVLSRTGNQFLLSQELRPLSGIPFDP